MEAKSIPDGMIALGSEAGDLLGFTSDKFAGSYLWKDGSSIVVSLIMSLERGNFRKLAETILTLGFRVDIPTPLGRMCEIVRNAGYTQEFRFIEAYGESVEIWYKEPVNAQTRIS